MDNYEMLDKAWAALTPQEQQEFLGGHESRMLGESPEQIAAKHASAQKGFAGAFKPHDYEGSWVISAMKEYALRYERELKALRSFKQYVHLRLDKMEVPVDPEPEHNKMHGCRIEGRLNFLKSVIATPSIKPPDIEQFLYAEIGRTWEQCCVNGKSMEFHPSELVELFAKFIEHLKISRQ